MAKPFSVQPRWAFAAFVALDVVCVGMGMGVPIFCIGFGFAVGWYIAQRGVAQGWGLAQVVRSFLPGALVTAGVTLLLMAIIWGGWFAALAAARADYANLGIPLILYEPKASFIGWEVLMIGISPFLQVLTTLFGAHVTLLVAMRRRVA